MSKVESGHILLTDEEFDMGELLQSVITNGSDFGQSEVSGFPGSLVSNQT